MRNRKKIAALLALLFLFISGVYGPSIFNSGGSNTPTTPSTPPVTDDTTPAITDDMTPAVTDDTTPAVTDTTSTPDVVAPSDVQNNTETPVAEETGTQGRSQGFWKHNVDVYVTGVGNYSGTPIHMTGEQLEQYASFIQAKYEPEFTLTWAQERFWDTQYNEMWLTIANWFNDAAGFSPYVPA